MRQELLPKANAECKVCGTPYYVCKRCIELRDKGIYAWKLDCDTPQCFQTMIAVQNYKDGVLSKTDALNVITEAQNISGIETYTSQYLELIEEIKTPDKKEEIIEKPIQVNHPAKAQVNNYYKNNKSGKRNGKR